MYSRIARRAPPPQLGGWLGKGLKKVAKTVKKVALPVAAVIAAPLTGGASLMAVLPAAGIAAGSKLGFDALAKRKTKKATKEAELADIKAQMSAAGITLSSADLSRVRDILAQEYAIAAALEKKTQEKTDHVAWMQKNAGGKANKQKEIDKANRLTAEVNALSSQLAAAQAGTQSQLMAIANASAPVTVVATPGAAVPLPMTPAQSGSTGAAVEIAVAQSNSALAKKVKEKQAHDAWMAKNAGGKALKASEIAKAQRLAAEVAALQSASPAPASAAPGGASFYTPPGFTPVSAAGYNENNYASGSAGSVAPMDMTTKIGLGAAAAVGLYLLMRKK